MLVIKIKMTNYNQVLGMAMQLKFGTVEQQITVGKTIERLDFDELENIVEESRGIMFDNSGDDQIIIATQFLVDFIQTNISTRIINKGFKNLDKLFKN